MSALGTEVIWYSLFNTAAVILPPRLTACAKVTKSPTKAPCALSVAVITALPFEALKVIPLVVVALIGVMSLYVPPVYR